MVTIYEVQPMSGFKSLKKGKDLNASNIEYIYNQIKMAHRNIDFHDSVENVDQWNFVKEKKERIKVKTQKAVNSEIYLSFADAHALYTFLFFLLAPEQAFGFQKLQPIIEKLRGDTEQSKRTFDECKRMLHVNWDGLTPLTHIVKRKRKDILRQQKLVHEVSQNITDEEAKQLLKSALSQRKIHLDYHTSDGLQQEAIIPTVSNINDCVTIIYDEKSNKYLLAFLSHADDEPEQKKQQQKNQANPNTFVNRPINPNAENPDDRPLPAPQGAYAPQGVKPVPAVPRQIQDPDQKLLPPPPSTNPIISSGLNRSSPRNIVNPDDRLLPPPPKVDPKEKKTETRLGSSRNVANQVRKDARQVEEKAAECGRKIEQKVAECERKVEEKATSFGRRLQQKVEHVVDDLRHDRYHWIQFGVAAIIIVGAIKILRS